MDKKINVVYASDNQFAEIMGVSLLSLYDNNKEFEEINVYILDSGICDDNIEKIDAVACQYKRSQPVYLKAINVAEKLGMNVELDRGSFSQYARLFVSSQLPKELTKVLYLDCDIIINRSLYELWNINMNGNTIGALKDAFSKYYRKNIDLEDNDVMFNSGVMLIDLCLWRKRDTERKLLDFIVNHKGKIQQGDQGALNAILSKETFVLSPVYNSITNFYDFNYEEMLVYRKPVDFYSKQEVETAVENPVIIHFTSGFMSERPWNIGCTHRYVGKWMEYKRKSPWADAPLRTPKKVSGLKGIYIKLTKFMPRKLVISISGLLQAYGRPLLNRFIK